MRRIELVWDDGQWSPEIAETIVEDILAGLSRSAWARPDSVWVVDAAIRDRILIQGPTE